jgi:hypothetical protein
MMSAGRPAFRIDVEGVFVPFAIFTFAKSAYATDFCDQF